MATANGSRSSNAPAAATTKPQRLETRFPVHSAWKLTLSPSDETVRGRIYCTDEASQMVVLQTALTHTTLATDMRIIHAASIVKAVEMKKTAEKSAEEGDDDEDDNDADKMTLPLTTPLPKVQKKALEDRERKAVRLAEESLRHINQKASPEGQLVFDKLVKACGEVVWKGESILVLKHVQVDPPYGPEHCKIVQRNATGKKALDDGSLERVKKIVAAAATNTSS